MMINIIFCPSSLGLCACAYSDCTVSPLLALQEADANFLFILVWACELGFEEEFVWFGWLCVVFFVGWVGWCFS